MKTLSYNLGLFANGLGSPVNFLEDNLHHCCLEFREKLHLRKGFLRFLVLLLLRELVLAITLKKRRNLDALSNSFRILVFSFLNTLLNVFWVVAL